ncbi:MAG TPA: glycosyltransferase family 4 protein [Bryobacteraceae bacterium]
MRDSSERRLRVLTVIDGLGFAGGESRILSMARGLDRSRFEHSVLTINSAAYADPVEFAARRSQYLEAGVAVHDLAELAPERRSQFAEFAPALHAKTGILRRARRLARVIRQQKVDAIDSHLESAGLVSVLAGQMTRTPVSMTIYCGGWKPDGMVWPRTTRFALRLADRVLTDSDIRAREMSELVPKRDEKFRVIPNGIPQPSSERSNSEMRRALRLPEDPRIRVVAQIGRFTEYKGQSVLLRAARMVLDREPETVFLLVGWGREKEYRAHLEALSRELGIAERVVMTEYPGSIGDVWKVIDVHAHASLFDSLPISIAEGMSLAKPAVVTSAGGIPEIVRPGETGLVVPPGDAGALAAGILRLLRESELAAQLGRNARRRYDEYYRPERMISALEDYFTELAGGKANTGAALQGSLAR